MGDDYPRKVRAAIRELEVTSLKPCPFCGQDMSEGEPLLLYGAWHVLCPGCQSLGTGCDKPERAVERWNRRAKEHPEAANA